MSYDYDRTKTASGFDPNTVAQIGRLRDQNNHIEALSLGAKMLGMSHTQKKIDLYAKLRDMEHGSTAWLDKYQYQLYEEVMNHAKRSLKPDQYEQFYGSF